MVVSTKRNGKAGSAAKAGNNKTATTSSQKPKAIKPGKAPGAAEFSKAEYHAALARINALTGKGSQHITPKEFVDIRTLALLAQAYEQRRYVIPPPCTFAGLLERRMYELKLRQNELAGKLGISQAKLSLIMNEKQRPDVAMIKAVHEKLAVDADLLLDVL